MLWSLVAWLVFGLVIGALARFLVPGRQPMSILMTILLGVAGSFAGGIVANLLTGVPVLTLHPAGFIGSLLGAIAILAITVAVMRRRTLA